MGTRVLATASPCGTDNPTCVLQRHNALRACRLLLRAGPRGCRDLTCVDCRAPSAGRHASVCACVGDDGCSYVASLARWDRSAAAGAVDNDRATVYGVHRWCDEACIPIDQSCDGVAYPPCSQFFSCDSCTQADAECCGCVNVCGHDVHDSCFRLPTAHPTR